MAILLVEGDAAVRDALAAGLRAYGHGVVVAGSGRDAVDPLIAHCGSFECLVSDAMLPGRLDGAAIARFARSLNPALMVIMMSTTPVLLDDLFRAGHDYHLLVKPFHLTTLTALIRPARLDARR